MAKSPLPPVVANDNDRDPCPVNLAQARVIASLPTYLRGGRI